MHDTGLEPLLSLSANDYLAVATPALFEKALHISITFGGYGGS